MRMKFCLFALMALVGLGVFSSGSAFADDGMGDVWSKERWQLRLRAIGVLPENGGNTTIGGHPEADNSFVPEFDITYTPFTQ